MCLISLFQQVQELQGCLFVNWITQPYFSLCLCSPSQPLLDRSLPDFNTFSSVEDWLSAIKMSQYRDNFLNSGFTSLQLVAQITSEWVYSLLESWHITDKTFQDNPVFSQGDWIYTRKSLYPHTESCQKWFSASLHKAASSEMQVNKNQFRNDVWKTGMTCVLLLVV